MNNAPLIGLIEDTKFLPLVGSEIGRSTARVAFEVQGHPNFVIKKALLPGAFSNRVEYLVWQQVADEPNLAAVLGACPAMSFSGDYLLMERLNDLSTSTHKAARRAPCWVTDRKPSNFGINASGEVKMRDYAQLNLGEFLARLPIVVV